MCDRRYRQSNVLMFREKLGKVCKICVVIFIQIKRNYSAADGIWNGRNRLSSAVAMDKSSFAITFIPQDHSIDCTQGTASFNSSTELVGIGVIYQRFNGFILFLFIHSEHDLFNKNPSHQDNLI